MGAFHAYDIRGVYNVDFDKDIAYKVGYFLPELLAADKVLVGRDARVSSDEIHEYLLKGITDAGADVYDAGLCTTPMVYFGTAFYGFKASVQITASHNPAEYNGMKVSRENALPVGYDTGLGQIKEWIEEGRECPVAEKRGEVHQIDVRKDYLPFLLKYKEDWGDLKIAMDVSNGMASLFVHEIFGDKPAYIYDEMDGRFPNHEPNPLVQKNVQDLKKLVAQTKADIGVIFDGDADRCLCVDEKGEIITGDHILYALGCYMQEKGQLDNNTVVTTVMSNFGLYKAFDEKGIDYANAESLLNTGGYQIYIEEMQPDEFFSELLRKLVPKHFVVPIAHELDVHSKNYIRKVTDAEINRLVKILKGFVFPITDYASFEYAVVTAGGVKCDEVNKYTMESLKVKGLYFAGEVLDLDANTGGYNLQIAFSTGRLAGQLKK